MPSVVILIYPDRDGAEGPAGILRDLGVMAAAVTRPERP